MSIRYGVNLDWCFHPAAYYVDKILKGAKPADLPVEFPTVPELWINQKTAKALGLKIPSTLLVRADKNHHAIAAALNASSSKNPT